MNYQAFREQTMDAINTDTLRPDARPLAPAAPAFDFQRILGSIRRHLRLFIVVALVVMALVAYLTLTGAPRYTATATLLIHQRTPDVLHLNALTPQDGMQGGDSADSSAVNTEAEILKSRALAAAVVDELHLVDDPEFNGALHPPGRLARLKQMLSRPAPGANDPAVIKQREDEGVIDAVSGDLSVKRTIETYTIEVGFTSFDPSKAARIANAFIEQYLVRSQNGKFDESHSATSWLDQRLGQLREQVQVADAAVQQYKIANNLLSAEGATLTEQEVTNLDTQLAQAKAQDAEQDARLRTAEHQLASGSNGGDVGEAMSSNVIANLRSQRSIASSHLADLTSHYGDRYPDVIKARQTLTDLDQQIAIEIQRVISNLKAQSQIAHTRTASLASTVSGTRGTLVGNNRAMVRLQELQRNDDAAREIYEAFLSRYKEATAKEGVMPPDAQLVSAAKLPTRASSPKKAASIIISVVLGLAAGVASIVLSELLEQGFSGVSDIESVCGLPQLAELPTLASTLEGALRRKKRLSPTSYVVAKPLSRFAEAFRNLRTSLMTARTGQTVQVIAITSSLPGEGKTTTSMCLARTVALSGSSVILVDCDLRQRSLNRLLQSDPEIGLLEVLNGTASLDEALVRDTETDALLLPLASSAFTPRDVFGSEAMDHLLAELRRRADVVLLDTAPVLAVADTRVLCPKADAVVFLTRWRKTSRKAVQTALRALDDGRTFIAGVALTQVNIREQARSGEGASIYYRAYRKYYAG